MQASSSLPILYSFRRCPYAIRARLTLWYTATTVELREVVLRDKPPEMLSASAKGTVPVLVLPDGRVIDESIDIMHWALAAQDSAGWLNGDEAAMDALIQRNDHDFKPLLDQYKYAQRYPEVSEAESRDAALKFLHELEQLCAGRAFLFSDQCRIADIAIAPFVRQFAGVNRDWFGSHISDELCRWLERFESSVEFQQVMGKYPRWQAGDAVTLYGPAAADLSAQRPDRNF